MKGNIMKRAVKPEAVKPEKVIKPKQPAWRYHRHGKAGKTLRAINNG